MGAGHALGERGERIALEFLLACGYRCLEKRYRRGGGELDLVMRRGDLVVFVEVKTRGVRSPAPAACWLHPRQRARLRRLAGRWLAESAEGTYRGCRFDLIAIDFGGEEMGLRLRHLVDVT